MALAQNTASLLIFRFIGGTFAAAPLTNSGALISDIWDARTRGKALAIFTVAPFAGPALGPTIAGFISVAGVSWRWLFWVLTIFVSCLRPSDEGRVLIATTGWFLLARHCFHSSRDLCVSYAPLVGVPR